MAVIILLLDQIGLIVCHQLCEKTPWQGLTAKCQQLNLARADTTPSKKSAIKN